MRLSANVLLLGSDQIETSIVDVVPGPSFATPVLGELVSEQDESCQQTPAGDDAAELEGIQGYQFDELQQTEHADSRQDHVGDVTLQVQHTSGAGSDHQDQHQRLVGVRRDQLGVVAEVPNGQSDVERQNSHQERPQVERTHTTTPINQLGKMLLIATVRTPLAEENNRPYTLKNVSTVTLLPKPGYYRGASVVKSGKTAHYVCYSGLKATNPRMRALYYKTSKKSMDAYVRLAGTDNADLGNIKPNVLPLPSSVSKMIAPPSAVITFLAINRPKPVPSGRAVRALAAR